ncbi:hypothetical protein ATCC90586_011105 [Pythium insidiosum]|nr:hypothetical protein ATCC90586_011105 [Pythium insidiosum]
MTSEEQQQQRVQLPRPRSADIDAILRLYESSPKAGDIWNAAQKALPFTIPRAKYDCIIETGTSLVSTAPSRILQSFVTKHGNDVVADLIAKKEIGQLSKLPRGNLCLKVKSEEARRRLEGQEVTILGHTYKFREHDPLEDRFYVDIAGVNGDTDVDQLFMRLFDIGAKPLYATNREVHLETGITTASLRVYFVDKTVPDALVVQGGTVNQLVFNRRLHFVNGKDAPPPVSRPKPGYRSDHCLDLDTKGDKNQGAKNHGTGGPKQSKKQRGNQGTKSDDTSKPSGDNASGSSTAIVLHQGVNKNNEESKNDDDAMSNLSLDDAPTGISPPSTPPATPGPTPNTNGTLSVIDLDDDFDLPRLKKRRFRDSDTTLMKMTKSPAAALDWTSDNFYAVLADVQGTYAIKDFSGADAPTPDPVGAFQVLPVLPPVPDSVKVNKARTKRMTQFITADATRVAVDDDWVAMEEFCAELEKQASEAWSQSRKTVEDQLANLPRAKTLVTSEPNIDKVIEELTRQPWSFNHVFMQFARDSNSCLETLADLHAFNRLLVTRTPDIVQGYTTRQCISKNRSVPLRESVAEVLRKWFESVSDQGFDSERLFDEWRALAFFELVLFSSAPHIMRSDAWVQYITSSKIEWMAHKHVRLLKTPQLLRLLRTFIGRDILERLSQVEWMSSLFATLQHLCTTSMYEEGFEPSLVNDDSGNPTLLKMMLLTTMMMRLERDVIILRVDKTKLWQDVIGSSPSQSAYEKWGTCEYCMTCMIAVL